MADIFGTALGIGQSFINNALASERTKDDRRENYMYGEMAAENADRRTRQLYNDLYSAEAKVQQAKEAGLSPSVLFSNGQALGAQGSSAGTQGTGASGIQTPVYGLEMAQTMKTLAETKLIEEQTKTEAGENEKGLAQIAQTWADAGYKKASSRLTDFQSDFQEMCNQIKDATSETEINGIIATSEAAQYNAIKTYQEARQAGLIADITDATLETQIKMYDAQYDNIVSQTNLNNEQQNYLKEQLKLESKRIALEYQNNKIYERSVAAQEKWYDQQRQNFVEALKQNKELAEKGFEVSKHNAWVQAGSHFLTGVSQAMVFGAFKTPAILNSGRTIVKGFE